MEDQQPLANNTGDIEEEDHHQYFDGRQIHRVHELVRFNGKNEDDYTPKMVSFGPYYHGLPKLAMAEQFKHKVLELFVSSSGKDKQFFYGQIFKVIDQIRNCYVGVSRDDCDDRALAEMILLDASFSIYLMKVFMLEERKYVSHFYQHLGRALETFAFQDLCLLDNQIPLRVVQLLIRLIYGNKEGPMLIWKFSKTALLLDSVQISITGEDKMQPLHLVGAFHQLLVEQCDNAGKNPSSCCWKNIKFKSKCQWWPWRKENPSEFGEYNRQSHSVTDLKAKGIHFKPSSCCWKNIKFKSKCQWWPWRKEYPRGFGEYNRQSHSVTDLKTKGIHFKPSTYCLTNIKFKSYTFYGQLQLPIWIFTTHSEKFFEQMIAYEASPKSNIDFPIICYVNFLKSLIVKSEDVKELREKKILFSRLDSDEKVVEVIKRINTCGLEQDYIFVDVKKEIEQQQGKNMDC